MQWTGLWTFPQCSPPSSATTSTSPGGRPPTRPPARRRCRSAHSPSTVAANSVDVEAAKAFVQWLWVDQTLLQEEFATAFGFHIPSRNSLAEAAVALSPGRGRQRRAALVSDNGFTQKPMLWSPASDTAYADARSRIIAEGADPETELAAVAEVVEQELERIWQLGGSASSAPAGTAPATTG